MDFMIDEDVNCWLIEANTNPCLEEASKLLEMLLPRMVDDMLTLTVDKIFQSEKTAGRKDFQGNLLISVLKQRN